MDPRAREAPVIDEAAASATTAGAGSIPELPPFGSVLMIAPDHFDVVTAINPHMADAEGRLKRPDRALARAQWDELRRTYERLGYPVHVLSGEVGLPDMTFAANQSFAFPRAGSGTPAAICSRMRHREREAEVPFVAAGLRELGFEVLDPPPAELGSFEGGGDLLWFPGRRLLLGGHGFRTERAALEAVAGVIEAPVILVRLRDPDFYHLDTCLAPLDQERALVVREAFDPAGLALLEKVFPKLLAVPPEDARRHLAANAHCPDGRHVIIEAEARDTIKLLRGEGFRVLPVPTSELLKSGGSVFCLKQMLPAPPLR